jgi:hypothetical protein
MKMHSGELAQVVSDAFDAHCQEKHELGVKKYSAVRFLEVDSIAMAMEEVVDLANYSRFTYIKLAMLQSFALEFEAQIGHFLRWKEEFAKFMADKGIDINEAPPAIENPADGKGANVTVDNGVPFVEAAGQPDGFFNPFRKQV